MRKLIRVSAAILILLFVLLIAAVVYLQTNLSSLAAQYVSRHYGITLKIGSAEIRFQPLSIRLENIELSSSPSSDPFLKAKSASAAIPYSSLRGKETVIQEIAIDSPELNLDTIPENKMAQTAGENPSSFRIEKLTVHSGKVHFRKYSAEGIEVQSEIDSGGMKVQQLEARAPGCSLSVRGAIENWSDPKMDFTYKLMGDLEQAAELSPAIQDVRGTISLSGEVGGKLSHLVVSGKSEDVSLSIKNSRPFIARVDYRFERNATGPPLQANVEWESLPAEVLHEYWTEWPAIPADSSGRAHYQGGFDFLNGAGTASMQISSPSAKLTGQVEASLKDRLVQIQNSKFQVGSTRITANGTLNQDAMTLAAVLDSQRLGDLARWYPDVAAIPGQWQLKATLSGPYNSLQLQGQLSGKFKDSSLHATGAANLNTKTVSLQFDGTTNANDLQQFVPEATMGAAKFGGSVQGVWTNPKVQANVDVSGLQISNITAGDVSGRVEGTMSLLHFSVQAPAYRSVIDGSYRTKTNQFEMEGSIDAMSVDELRPMLPPSLNDLNGQFTARFNASGDVDRWKQSKVELLFDDGNFHWREEEIVLRQGSTVSLEKGKGSVDLEARLKDGSVNIKGTVPLSPHEPMNVNLSGFFSGTALKKVTTDWEAEGSAEWNATVTGTRNQPRANGTFASSNLSVTYLPRKMTVQIDQFNAAFSGADVTLTGEGRYNQAHFRLDGVIPIDEGPGNLNAEITSIPLNEIQPDLPVTGQFDVVLKSQGSGFPLQSWTTGQTRNFPFRAWTSSIVVTPTNLKYGQHPISLDTPLLLTLNDGIVTLAPCRVTSADMLDVFLSGNLNLRTWTIDSTARMLARTELLSTLNPDIQTSGSVTADFSVRGNLHDPDITGKMKVSNASLFLADSPLSFEKIELEASLDDDRIRLDKLEARSGGGTITGGGELVKGVSGSSIWLSGRKVALLYPEGLRSQSNCDLKFTSAGKKLIISGDVVVLRSFYDQDFTFRNPLIRQLLARTSTHARESFVKNSIMLNLNLRTQDDFVLENTLAVIRAAGNIKVEGTLYQPRTSGRIQIRDGSRLFISGKTYVVEKANLDFFPGELLEPTLDVEISTLAQDMDTNTFYDVFVRLGGPFSNIQFRGVRSTPTLSETQVFNLLTYGTVRTSLSKASAGGVFRQQLVSAFTGQVFAAPVSHVARSIGLSRINVQQEGLTAVNDPKTRLVLAKDVGAGFSLIYSFVLNEPQDYTWIAAYRYQNKFFVRYIGQDDGTYTASFNHRIPFGGHGELERSMANRPKRYQPPIISSLTISNQSSLDEKYVRDVIGVSTGSEYDYWSFLDRLEIVRAKLQSMGYLSPVVEVTEKDVEGNRTSLSLELVPGDKGEMTFRGIKVTSKQSALYRKWWAQGISPAVVQNMIRKDLQEQLNMNGYQQATVLTRSEQVGDKTVYSFDVTTGPLFKNAELQFQGIQVYTPRDLQKILQTFYASSGKMFTEAIHDPDGVAENIKVLYVQRGYAAASVSSGHVTYDKTSGTVTRAFSVQEGSPMRVLQVTENGGPLPAELSNRLRIQKDGPVVPQDLLDDQAGICNYYEGAGYQDCSADFKVQLQENNTRVVLEWDVDKGPIAHVGSVQITGYHKTSDEFIFKQLRIQQGDVLTPVNQSLAQKRLYDLGVFNEVDLEKRETASPGIYDLVVNVVENQPYEIQYGARYNTDDKLGAELRLINYNFLGRAQQLSFYGRSDLDEPLFRIDYILPHTEAAWQGMRFSIFRDERDDEIHGIQDGEKIDLPYTIREFQFQVQQSLPIGLHHQVLWDVNYGPENAKTRDFEPSFEAEGVRTLLHAVLVGDYRNDAFTATSGFFYSIDGQTAPSFLDSDILYDKTYGQFFYFRKLGPLVLASGVRAGFLNVRSQNLAISEKFRSGGSTTLRGFELNAIHPNTGAVGALFGGDSVLIFNEELRFQLHKYIQGAIFYDGGNVYTRVSDFDPTDIRNSAGFGFRLGTGGFLFRLDLGFNLQPEEFESHSVFHFAIGQAF